MDIKEKLKEIGIKLSDLARELEVSRPTLNIYIDNFEKGTKIPSEKYQLIFVCF